MEGEVDAAGACHDSGFQGGRRGLGEVSVHVLLCGGLRVLRILLSVRSLLRCLACLFCGLCFL